MRLLVLSDSHGRKNLLLKAVELHPEANAVIFLGDGERDIEFLKEIYPELKLYAVCGNCDFNSANPPFLLEKFGGEVPDSREELMILPGVGRKTANVVLNVVFHKPVMPVDTHLLRISPKIGLAEGTTPEKVESSLVARIPEKYMEHAHHWLILHGRYVCTARNPRCKECFIGDICRHNEI